MLADERKISMHRCGSVWETVTDNFQKAYFPSDSVTVDEQLFSCKAGVLSFNTCHRSPASLASNKYWRICDAKTNYVLNAVPYVSRDKQQGTQTGLGEHITGFGKAILWQWYKHNYRRFLSLCGWALSLRRTASHWWGKCVSTAGRYQTR